MPAAKSARLTRLALLSAVLLLPIAAQAAERWFSIRGKPDFADVRAQLEVVAGEHAHQKTNRFYVAGETVEGVTQAWVYWPDGGKLILWRPDRDNPHAIAGSNRYLDLKRDVVKGDDVHGSTYLLTRVVANKVIRACKETGDIYTIERPAGSGILGRHGAEGPLKAFGKAVIGEKS